MIKKPFDYRSGVSVILLFALTLYLGCSGDPPAAPVPPAPTKAAPGGVVKAASASPGDKLMAELDNPAALLIVSGQQDGYMEPCGCSAEQIGGLIRRYDLVERMQKQNWPVSPRSTWAA